MGIDWFKDYKQVLDGGNYMAIIRVGRCNPSKKFPEGVTARLVLLDMRREKPVPRLLIDNHEPFGFHIHSQLPDDHSYRENLDIDNYQDAIRVFFEEARKVINEGNEDKI